MRDREDKGKLALEREMTSERRSRKRRRERELLGCYVIARAREREMVIGRER